MSKRKDLSDWRLITNEKERYQAYLCSREWSEKKEAVHKRSGGTCERCEALPGNAVHHLTYARKYQEDLDDLQHTCNACHDFTHGKHSFDPKPARWFCDYAQDAIGDGLVVIETSAKGRRPPDGQPAFAIAAVLESRRNLLLREYIAAVDEESERYAFERFLDFEKAIRRLDGEFGTLVRSYLLWLVRETPRTPHPSAVDQIMKCL